MAILDDVFGISARPILSYTEREQVDGNFVRALSSDRHIVIYGSSKQGKTSLRQKHIEDAGCTIVRCGPRTTTEAIYQAILRGSGVTIDVMETTTEAVKGGTRGKWGFKAMIPWFGGADAEGEVTAEASRQESRQVQYVGFDLGDAQSITELLKRVHYRKYVILENFHYLPEDTQKLIAFDLKSFHEVSIRFVILGIWKEANYLLLYNGDLQDRVVEIPVEPWESQDFDNVISIECKQLNISVSEAIRAEFKKNAYGNIGMLQEFMKTYCRLSCIEETTVAYTELTDTTMVATTFEEKLMDQKGRLIKVLQSIAGQSRTDSSDPLTLPYYLVQVLLTAPIAELSEGIRRQDLLEKLRNLHHRENKNTVRMSDLSNLLKRIPALQEGIQPPFLYYDTNQLRLKIVDGTQFFVLARVDRQTIWDEIPNPLQQYDA
jgi:hypothetical protein